MKKESPQDPCLQQDLEALADGCEPLRQLNNCSVLVTGATGLVGSLLVKAMACHNRISHASVLIIPFVRSSEKAKRIYGELFDREDLSFCYGDITKPLPQELHADYIFHCASVTASKTMVTKPVETIFTALDGTRNVLDFARASETKAVVYASSMEMYGSFGDQSVPVTEEMTGQIDPLLVRSNYPESKRMCENLCVAYLNEYGVQTKIARLAQTFGAGVLPEENRVFAQFAKSAAAGKDIVLHSFGRSEGNYCYTADAVAALFTILLSGEAGQAYNVTNESTHTTIADMARLVAERFAPKPVKAIFDVPASNVFGYAQDVKMKLSAKKLSALGWTPQVGLEEAYRRMLESMRNQGIV